MDFRLTPEQELLKAAVAGIAGGYGHEYFQAKTREGAKPDELWAELGRGGFLGVHLPEAYGGGGMGISELAIVCEEVAAAGCPLLLILVSPAICADLLATHGSEAQKQRWLPHPGHRRGQDGLCHHRAGCRLQLAPHLHDGTRATATSGDSTARSTTSPASTKPRRSSSSPVRAPTRRRAGPGSRSSWRTLTSKGFEARLIPVEIAAPEKQFTLFFDDCVLGEDRLLGREGDGLRQVFAGLNPERLMAAAVSCGIGRYALDRAAAYARERRVWDRPIGAHQGVAHPLAKAKIEVELARLMLTEGGLVLRRGLEAGEAANMAKYAAAEACLGALDQAIQTYGGNGLASEYGLADLWGAARLLRTAPVSREMILNFVAQHSLGLPKSY